MALSDYHKKRHFNVTPEPQAGSGNPTDESPQLRFTIHKHAARRLHYDLRLELDGVLKSWAVPKGPCLDPQEKRLAIHVEDHPIEYLSFEGVIPKGEYGAGPMLVWDQGTWATVPGEPGYEAGQLKFELNGHKLQGRWMLVRTSRPSDRQDQWLFFKERDAMARPLAEVDVLKDSPLQRHLWAIDRRGSQRTGSSVGIASCLDIEIILAETQGIGKKGRAPRWYSTCRDAAADCSLLADGGEHGAGWRRVDSRDQVRWLPNGLLQA